MATEETSGRSISRLFDRSSLVRGLVQGGLAAVIVMLLWAGNLFVQFRLGLNDVYYAPSPDSDNIVIVAIDDASLADYGRSPLEWSREVYAELVDVLANAQARVIAFDLLFSEATAADGQLATALNTARSMEARTRIVMPVVGGQLVGDDSNRIVFANVLQPTPILRDSADYLGYTNTIADADGRIRRQPSLVYHGDTVGLSFSMASYAAYLRLPVELVSSAFRLEDKMLILPGEHAVPADTLGIWRQNYFGPPSTGMEHTFQVYSLRDVVNQVVETSVFRNKIVLVGLINATGATDRYPVPSLGRSTMLSGVEIHANAIDSLIQGKYLDQASPELQALLIILLSIGAGVLYAPLRWYWTLLLALVLILTWSITAFAVFITRLTIIDLFYSYLALLLPLGINLGLRMSLEVRLRQRSVFLLENVLKVSKQSLDLAKIGAAIATDALKVLPAEQVAVWLLNPGLDGLKLAYSRPPLETNSDSQLNQLFGQMQTAQRTIMQYDRIAVPIFSQGRLLGAMALRLPPGRRVPDGARRLLEGIADQIAPSVENARLYHEVAQQKSLVDAIINSAPVAVIVLADDLSLRSANPAAAATLGVPVMDYLGKPLNVLLEAAKIADAVHDQIQRQLRSSGAWQADLLHNGIAYDLVATPMSEGGGWVIIMNDVSTLFRLNELKTRMIRMAAHDLKNPLATIMGYAQLIQISEAQQEQQTQEFAGSIVKSAKRMRDIVSDILDLEQLRSNQIQYDSVDLAVLLKETIDHLMPFVKDKLHDLDVELAESLPSFFGDRRQIEQALTNLISNAVKYTPDNGTIRLRLYQEDAHFRIEVADTGYGIPAEAQSKLFTEFYRVRSAATAHIEGTGLGLNLVKSVIEAHDGRIWFESEEGVGTTFFVELPVAATEFQDIGTDD